MVYKIYGLYDPENNLRYVGYTKKSLNQRLKEHWNTTTRIGKQPRRICWLKSLKEKPTIKLLDKDKDFDVILAKEKFWIKYYRDKGFKLTNTCDGGLGSKGHKWTNEDFEKQSKKVKQFTKEGELIKIHNSLSDASFAVSGSKKYNGKISGYCNGKRGRISFKGFIWRYEKDDFDTYAIHPRWNVTEEQKKSLSKRQSENNCMKGRKGKSNPKSKPILQFDKDKNYLGKFDSMTIAAKETNVSQTSISESCRKGVVRNGYYWEYANKDIV